MPKVIEVFDIIHVDPITRPALCIDSWPQRRPSSAMGS
jgi:hypothetical protein